MEKAMKPVHKLPFKKFIVTVNHLNLRKDPSLTGKMAGSMQAGEVVECFKVAGDDYWFKIRNQQGVEGWATHKHLISLANDSELGGSDNSVEAFPWMTVAIREMGVHKYTGYTNNPRITEYLSSVTLGHEHPVKDDIYWNSAFANWCLEKSGCDGTDSTWARAWANWGQATETPKRGCIVVLKRSNGTAHVGFYVQELGDKIEILGANKIDEVGYHYFLKENVLSYRVPFSN